MRRGRFRPLVTAAILVLAGAGPAGAQTRNAGSTTGGVEEPRSGGWRPLRVAKWTTLAAGIAAAGYGFAASIAADDRDERIDRLCAESPSKCVEASGGGFADEEVDRLHGEARRLDRRARLSLIASQVGVAASVALFLLDLRNVGDPPNIPYGPARLRIEPGRDGVTITLRLDWPGR